MPKIKLNDAQRLAINLLWQDRQKLQKEIADLQAQIVAKRGKLRQLSFKGLAHRFNVSEGVIERAIFFVPKQTKWRRVVMPSGKASYRRPLRVACSKCRSVMCSDWSHRSKRKTNKRVNSNVKTHTPG